MHRTFRPRSYQIRYYPLRVTYGNCSSVLIGSTFSVCSCVWSAYISGLRNIGRCFFCLFLRLVCLYLDLLQYRQALFLIILAFGLLISRPFAIEAGTSPEYSRVLPAYISAFHNIGKHFLYLFLRFPCLYLRLSQYRQALFLIILAFSLLISHPFAI